MSKKQKTGIIMIIAIVVVAAISVTVLLFGGYKTGVSIKSNKPFNQYNLQATGYEFSNGKVTLIKNFYWDHYAYQLMFTQNDKEKLTYNESITLTDQYSLTVYADDAQILQSASELNRLTELLSKIKEEAGEDLKKDMFCVVSKYEEIGADLETAMAKSYSGNELWLFQALYPELDQPLQSDYLEKTYEENKIDFFVTQMRIMSEKDITVYAEKAYEDNKIDFFCVLMGNLKEQTLNDYKTRAKNDKKTDFYMILANSDATDFVDEILESTEEE